MGPYWWNWCCLVCLMSEISLHCEVKVYEIVWIGQIFKGMGEEDKKE
jgi:hypothetical protein